ncbi:MAG: hypothetical protein QOH41_1001 [Blastocatellia bacterium]|nr:hypothetical protein [Blastocatellia bacterium]
MNDAGGGGCCETWRSRSSYFMLSANSLRRPFHGFRFGLPTGATDESLAISIVRTQTKTPERHKIP